MISLVGIQSNMGESIQTSLDVNSTVKWENELFFLFQVSQM